MTKDIFERSINGEPISNDDPEFWKLADVLNRTREILADLNSSHHEPEEIRHKLRDIGVKIDESALVLLPFYTDVGMFTEIGKNSFINQCCMCMGRGGIKIEDNVKIGPRVNLITENHGLKASERRILTSKSILIRHNAWIGAAATIMPGVTIGENSIVGAGAVVTHDVPSNVIVAGVPAKIIKPIPDEL